MKIKKTILRKNINSHYLPLKTGSHSLSDDTDKFELIGHDGTNWLVALGKANGWNLDSYYINKDEPLYKEASPLKKESGFWWVPVGAISEGHIVEEKILDFKVGDIVTKFSGRALTLEWKILEISNAHVKVEKSNGESLWILKDKIQEVHHINGELKLQPNDMTGCPVDVSVGDEILIGDNWKKVEFISKRSGLWFAGFKSELYYYTNEQIEKLGLPKLDCHVDEKILNPGTFVRKTMDIKAGDFITSIRVEDVPCSKESPLEIFFFNGEEVLIKDPNGWELGSYHSVVKNNPNLKKEIGNTFKWLSKNSILEIKKGNPVKPITLQEFKNLKVGDKVVYRNNHLLLHLRGLEGVIKKIAGNTVFVDTAEGEFNTTWSVDDNSPCCFNLLESKEQSVDKDKKEMTPTKFKSKQDIVDKITKVISKENKKTVFYGSYVRDLISRRDSNEIVLFDQGCKNDGSYLDFVQSITGWDRIKAAGPAYVKEIVKVGDGNALLERKFTIKTDEGFVDIKIRHNKDDGFNIPCYLSTNVDSLFLRCKDDGSLEIDTFWGYALPERERETKIKEVIDDIRNNVYIPIQCDGYPLETLGFKHKFKYKEKEDEMKLEDVVKSDVPEKKSMIRRDLENLAYRQGAEKVTMGVRASFQLILSQLFKLDKEQMKTINYMLEQPAGEAVLALAIGYGLHLIPAVSDNEIADRLAENFRAQGWHQGTNAGLDKVMSLGNAKLIPFIQNVMASIKMAQSGDIMGAAAALKEIEVPDNLRVNIGDDSPSLAEELQDAEEEELEFNQVATCI